MLTRGDHIIIDDPSVIKRYKSSKESHNKFYRLCLEEYDKCNLKNKPIILNGLENPEENAKKVLKHLELF